MWKITLAVATFLLVLALLSPGRAMAQSSPFAFTYQGRLLQEGQPYTGTADLEFALFQGVTQRGTVVRHFGTAVEQGVFTVVLDFGVDITDTVRFSLDGDWSTIPQSSVEVRVRTPAGSPGPFTTLLPRQPLTPAPLASSMPGFGRGNTSESLIFQPLADSTFQINAQVTQSFVPTRTVDLESIELIMVNMTGQPVEVPMSLIRGNFTLIGASTATAPNGIHPVRFDFPAGTTLTANSNHRMEFNTTTTLGVRYASNNPFAGGTTNFNPNADLRMIVRARGQGGWFSSIPLSVVGGDSTVLQAVSTNVAGAVFRLTAAAGSSAAWSFHVLTDRRLRIVPDSAPPGTGLTIDGTGRVGIGTDQPDATLHVDGDILIRQVERSLSVPAFAFIPQGPTPLTYTGSGAISAGQIGVSITLNAPLHLPHGAVINRFQIHVIDNDPGDMFGSLRGYSKTSDAQLFAISCNTSGAAAGVRTFTSTSPLSIIVDNQTVAYLLRINWTGPAVANTLQFRGMTVFYTIKEPLP